MHNPITKFQKRILHLICRKLIVQGCYHQKNIVDYYAVIIKLAIDQFPEDNDTSLKSFMVECHDEAINKAFKRRG